MHEQNAPLRHIRLQGASNFRDLGGYRIGQDRSIIWRKLFRSDSLHQLTPSDLETLSRLGIKTYIDLRSAAEQTKAPDIVAPGVLHTIHLPFDTDASLAGLVEAAHGDIDSDTYMLRVYETLTGKFFSEYRHFFSLLSDPANLPLVFHCMEGKDRTGVAAALFLSALGVSKEQIFEDYLLSDKHLSGKYDKWKNRSREQPFIIVNRSYMEAVFAIIDNEFGGAANYLENHLHINSRLLKDLYTEFR